MNWEIIHIDETDSTNRWLVANRTEGQNPCVVVADYQTAGRGCGTNKWESERGKNLLFSMLIHPTEIPVNKQFVVSMAVANSIAAVVAKYVTSQVVSVKWPNDIYVGDKKICGILIENRLQGGVIKDSIIGVGLNVNQLCFVSDAPNPVSMANITGRQFDREQLLQELLEAFQQEWADLEGVRERYLQQLYRRKGFFRYRDAYGECTAEIVTVEADGHLVLQDVDGRTNRYAFKEIQFVI
ncbi:BirA family transcriptional regulator, biotin operon repressor / biotin-[acetyl-CoA-carboxylase] ligase [Prevotellaceae bacterium MN60]|nr:BirA family transcriptional regulator, biotin operon repressor / biotin-[acetyl-CoA-carboxylase] ligase [Prevotellaceae bacterium MN60]